MWVMAKLVWTRLLTRPLLIFFALGLLGLGVVAFDSEVGVIRTEADMRQRGLNLLVVMSTLVVIFLGAMQVATEIRDKSALLWLTRPLERWQFVTGKFFGTFGAGLGVLMVLGGLFSAMMSVRGYAPGGEFILAIFRTALWLGVLAAIATFLSCRTTYMGASLFGLLITGAGTAAFLVQVYIAALEPLPIKLALWALYLVLPNWQHFSADIGLTHGLAWLALLAYAASLAGFYLLLGIFSIVRKDIA